MSETSFDIIVIGAGPGGYHAAIRGAQLGLSVAVVEKDDGTGIGGLGGVCLNWGCIPTKALLKSAQVFEYLKKADQYGLSASKIDKDFTSVVKRSRSVADGMSKGVNFLMKKNKIDVINGFGKILPEKKVSVEIEGKKNTYSAENIIIATGARSREINSIKQDGKKIIGYREAMVLPKQPKKMIIVGSGAIGVEFAYFYNSMGTEVTIVEYLDRILPVEDKDISNQLAKSFKKSGIDLMTSSEVISSETKGKGVKLQVKSSGQISELEADIVISAVGIKSNIENMGLEETGIAVDNDKILVDEFYKTNIPGYYAIGDIVTGQALAHVASAEGILCVEKIAGKNPGVLNYDNIPSCTYCNPEVASVGYTEKQAIDLGYDINVGKFPFSASGKANAAGHSEGFVKVIFDKKYGEWLGCHMVGYNVTEMIAEVVAARKLETTAHEIIKSVHPHPTMSEAIMEATAAAYNEVIHL